jgi:hypothetical protein
MASYYGKFIYIIRLPDDTFHLVYGKRCKINYSPNHQRKLT